MRDPCHLDWQYGEPYPQAGSRPSRRPLPRPAAVQLPNRVRITTYRTPWWQQVDWSVVIGVSVSLFAVGYVLAHILRWLQRWPL